MSKVNETDIRQRVIAQTERDVANAQRDAALAESAALRAQLVEKAAPPPAPPAPPVPATPSIADEYRRLKAIDPYLGAQFLLNHQTELVAAFESERTK